MEHKKGKLTGIGVGPGDPQLLTVKALRAIEACDMAVFPGEDPKETVAYKIVEQVYPQLGDKELLAVPMPMTKDPEKLEKSHKEGADRIAGCLEEGKNLVFLTLGDPTVYSTYLYVHKRLLEMGYQAEIISGITSFCAVAARLNIGLVEKAQQLHVIPASYQIEEALKELGETYNFELLTSDANYDINTQLSQIDTAITQGIDGAFLFIVDEGSATAAVDKFNAAGIPVIGETLKLQDGNGNNVAPYVELDAEAVGGECGTWIAENWEDCGIEISDWSKVGVISNTQTTRQSDLARSTGFENALKEGLPEIPEENYLIADNAAEANNNDAENSYNQVSAVLAAHPEIETWFVIGTVDNYAMGACRAIEAAGLEDQTILVSCGGEYAVREWAEGTGACWRAACYYEAMDFAVEMVDGMLEIVRDGVPATDIYADSREEGQEYAAVGITGNMITPDNYTEYVSQ